LVLLVAVSKNAAIENVHNETQEEAVSTEASVSTEDTTVEDNSYHIYTSQSSGPSLKVKKLTCDFASLEFGHKIGICCFKAVVFTTQKPNSACLFII